MLSADFVSKIVLRNCEKKYSSDRGKYLKFEAVDKFYNFLNNERKVQFLKQNTFSTCFWRFLRLQFTSNGMHKLEQLEFKSQNIIGI